MRTIPAAENRGGLQVLPLLLHTRVWLTGSPTHTEYGIAFAIADPCRIRDCLHMLAHHVNNVHALITPAPGGIPRLSQPPLQTKAECGHPGGPFVNLLLVPRVCTLLVSSNAIESAFRPNFL